MTRPGLTSHHGLSCRLGLQDKLAAVVSAREQERVVMTRTGISSLEISNLRWLTLSALEAYAGDLESLAWPVPRDILQDIRLRRALLAAPTRVDAPDRSRAAY
jgi:hypothetical protein